MAGGKLTPRQKMINLMYLVFIAMLALNMSKEVLSAFGLMNEKFENINSSAIKSNENLIEELDKKATETGNEYLIAAEKAHKIEKITNDFNAYLESQKSEITKETKTDESGKLPYEQMDKADVLDQLWFGPNGLSPKGEEFKAKITEFKKNIGEILGKEKKYNDLIKELDTKFSTEKVKTKDGLNVEFLSYHFQGFPAIASLAKLTAWQNDVHKVASDVYSYALGKAATQIASMDKFEAIVVLEKSAYFAGEAVKGKVVLGKYDSNQKINSFSGPGKVENGQAIISLTAGSVGEQSIGGAFTFLEDGKVIEKKWKGNYVVVPRPNSATISADKMNVVYRGVDNPMTISFAGVPDNAVSASAAGMTKATGNGKYIIRPTTGSELLINVSGKLSDGSTVSDKKTYRIKDIPGPTGTIGGDMGVVKGPISRLENSQIGALIPGFDFDVKLNVIGFNLKVTGQPTVVVTGNRLSPQAKSVLKKVQRGDQVTISEIKTKLEGSAIFLPRTNIVIFEVN